MSHQEQPNGPGTLPGARAATGCGEPVAAASAGGLWEFTRRLVVAVVILTLVYLAWRGVHVLLVTFAGVLFAVFLSAVSGWLSRRTGMAYRWSLVVVAVALAVLIGGGGWLLASLLTAQIAELARDLPRSLEQIRDYLEAQPWGRSLLEKAPQAAASLGQGGDFTRVTGLVSGVGTFVVDLVVVVFVGIFGAADPGLYRRGLIALIPPRRRRRASQVVDAVAAGLRGWLVGQAFLMLAIGATTALGLWLLGMPLALTLGLLAGVLELVPYVGPWMSAVPALLIALLLGPQYLVLTAALYLAVHLLEGYVLLPLIQHRAVHLPPALTLVAQVLLGELLGGLGLVVAAPLAVVAVVFVKMLYVEDALGDTTGAGPAEPERVNPPARTPGATAPPPPGRM